LNSGLVDIDPNHVLASGDDIKPLLPEYKNGEPGSAAFVHEESSFLSKEIASKAAKGSYNVVMDGTGDNSIEALSKKVSSMVAKGQTTKGIYVTCDIDTAIARSAARAKATGRYMPESVLRSTHASVSKVFPEIVNAGLFDDLELYDTSSGKATLIAKAAGKTLTVHDWSAYKTFLGKAGG
jgi:predicted ABC-type ATPase